MRYLSLSSSTTGVSTSIGVSASSTPWVPLRPSVLFWLDTALDLWGRWRPVVQDSPLAVEVWEPVPSLLVRCYAVVADSETFQRSLSDTLGVEYVSKGGHGSLDPSLGDSLRAKFHFTDLSWTMDESFDREFRGTSEESEGCHPSVGNGNGLGLLNYISFRTRVQSWRHPRIWL